jgi:hypothetical protein
MIRGVLAAALLFTSTASASAQEQPHRVSARLAEVRREIAAGRFVRNVVQGQPYWTRVA